MEGKFMLIISLFCAVAVMGKPAQENDGKEFCFSFLPDSRKTPLYKKGQ